MGVRRSLLEVVVMNCFGSHTESTESFIRHEDVSEVIELSNMEIKEEEDEDQTEEEVEVGEEMEEEKLLTDEEVRAIAEEVDKRE